MAGGSWRSMTALFDSIRHNLEETKKAAERSAPLIRQLLA
jgi:hypothetical protein